MSLHTQQDCLTHLEECCGLLAQSTKNLENQFMLMHDSVEFQETTITINNINTSPNHHCNKQQKPDYNTGMDLE
jgi:hypothetical protein